MPFGVSVSFVRHLVMLMFRARTLERDPSVFPPCVSPRHRSVDHLDYPDSQLFGTPIDRHTSPAISGPPSSVSCPICPSSTSSPSPPTSTSSPPPARRTFATESPVIASSFHVPV